MAGTVADHPFGLLRPPAEILFGHGVLAALPRVLASLGRRIFVCADPAVLRSAGFEDFTASAPGAGLQLEIFSDFAPELPLADVNRAVETARPHAPDVVLGFGGGSALDLAKLVALGIASSGTIADHYGENLIPHSLPPIIAVPTTAGTGSEVTPIAVVGDPDRELKVGVSSPHLVPAAAVVDPSLTHTCPPHVTAFSGIDALCHAIESYTARTARPALSEMLPVFVGANAMSSLLAREAAQRIVEALPRAVADGGDTAARESMSYASLLAGMAFATGGTHLAHAIQYPIGATTHTPHGLGVGLLLPYVMEACLPYTLKPLGELGRAFGSLESDDESAAVHAIRTVVRVRDQISVPHTLAELTLTARDLPKIVDLAATVTRLVANAPAPDPAALIEPIIRRAWSGASSYFPTSTSRSELT